MPAAREARTIRIKPNGEVAMFLAEIRDGGGDAFVDTDEGIYRIHMDLAATRPGSTREPKVIDEALPKHEVWVDYDPQRVRAALRRSARIARRGDAEDLIRDIYEMREQDTPGHRFP
jgi:hypothetical protein